MLTQLITNIDIINSAATNPEDNIGIEEHTVHCLKTFVKMQVANSLREGLNEKRRVSPSIQK